MDSFKLALSFLTIIPSGKLKNYSDDLWCKSVYFYPLCGYIIAFITLLPAYFLVFYFKSNNLVIAAVTLSILTIIPGALHLDGFADLCDGFFCPTDKNRRIEIIHDSSVGSFGIVGLILLLLIKFSAISVLINNKMFFELFGVIVIARFFIVFLASISTCPAKSSIGKFLIGKLSIKTVIISFICILPFLFSYKMIILLFILLLITVTLRYKSYKLIDGVTGDVLGAESELCEACGFLLLSLLV